MTCILTVDVILGKVHGLSVTHVASSEHTTHMIKIFPAWNVHKRHQLIGLWLVVFKEEREALELLTMLRS